MRKEFSEITFTEGVKAEQERMGSRGAYDQMVAELDPSPGFGDPERAFLALRDSFYMASVGETGWPYIQHRGGPPGFLKVLGAKTLGFADFRGNRQYISTGNIAQEERVSLFLMDYPNRRRLKVLGRARAISPMDDPELAARLSERAGKAHTERLFVIEVEGFDWNCPQYITPRFTLAELQAREDLAVLRVEQLETENAELRRKLAALGGKAD